jgi:hypothetical protein
MSVLRSMRAPRPVIGGTECQELKVLTNSTAWFGA